MAKQQDRFTEKFAIDENKRLKYFMSVSALLGILIGSWVITTEFVIPTVLAIADQLNDTTSVTVKLTEKKKAEKKKEEKKVKKKSGAGGKPKGKGDPKAHLSKGVLQLITAKSKNNSLEAYNLMNQKFAKDVNKVINQISGLTKTGETRLGGRRGRLDGTFNEGYAAGGEGGIDDLLGSLLGGDAGPIGVKAKGNLKAPSASDIDLGQSSGQRSTADILRVIRQHSPGLRHTYNKHLKTNPGFSGKVTVRFTIAPSGKIIQLDIVSTTTGVSEFDSEIRGKIMSWRFEQIKGTGNDIVTVPFTFSE